MSKPNDIASCTGQAVPFGSAYTTECKTCTRSQRLEPSKHTVWIGPMVFEKECPEKIKEKE